MPQLAAIRHYIFKRFDSPENTTCYTGSPANYTGNVSVTETGTTCLAWADYDHGGDYDYQPEDFTDGVLPSNYCRFPLSDPEEPGRPWCFTDVESGDWEFCDVHQCTDDTYTTSGEDLQASKAGILMKTGRQADRQTDRQAGRQADSRQTGRQAEKVK